jgi:hypothetical protein
MTSCFKAAWKKHSLSKHLSMAAASRKNSIDYLDEDQLPEASSPEITTENDEQNEQPDLQTVSYERIYTPCDKDVGSSLRVEVTAVSTNDPQHVLAGPVSLISDSVLASPSACPKRPLLTMAGAAVGTSSAITRFRVVSYNILSEVYATKQVSDLQLLSKPDCRSSHRRNNL